MKKIKLTKDKYALVDDEDFDHLNTFNWFANIQKDGYTRAIKNKTLACSHTKMHRMILNITDKNIKVDHKNGKGLNNQKINLRVCNDYQNACNAKSVKGTTSKYKGVSFHKATKTWRATIFKNYKQISLGYFKTQKEAAEAYNKKASELQGEFAKLNKIKT